MNREDKELEDVLVVVVIILGILGVGASVFMMFEQFQEEPILPEMDETEIYDFKDTYVLVNGTYDYSFEHPDTHRFYCVLEPQNITFMTYNFTHTNETLENVILNSTNDEILGSMSVCFNRAYEITNRTYMQLQNVGEETKIQLWAKKGTTVGSIVTIPVFFQWNITETTQNV